MSNETPFTNIPISYSYDPNKDRYMYPRHPDFEYKARLERINLDDERENDILTDNGFIISEPQSIKKDVKSINSIFSSRFGQSLQDVNPFADRYKCDCGNLTSRIHHNMKCPICNTRVRYVDDNFSYFGWICLKDPYYVIHPNLYKSIQFFIGAKALDNIINTNDEKDENGFSIRREPQKDQPFYGIGMMKFKERFVEIMDHYYFKNPDKVDYYHDIMDNLDKVFTQSIPVYTTHLRPFRIKDDSFTFEGTNGIYNIICRLVATINKDQLKMNKKRKAKDQLLYDVQVKYNELYKELENVISGKKGSIRSLIGGRYNYSARSVIVPDQSLRIDQVKLPYKALVELLSQSIINILSKTYNMTFSEAYKVWYKASIKKDQRVVDIINSMIRDHKNGIYDNLTGEQLDTFDNVSIGNNRSANLNYGIPVLINRNP